MPRQHRRLAPARRGVVVAALAALAAVGLPAQPTSAATMLTWTGTVTRVVDGDTAYVDINGDGLGPRLVRNAGIQAVEKGQCQDAAATARYKQIAEGRTVRLQAERAASSSLGRPLRFIDVRNADGTYSDVQLQLVREGHAMWLNNLGGQREDARTDAYHYAAEQAAAARVGLYDSDQCGSGPYQSVKLRLWVSYDAEGDDSVNINGEYIRILNPSSGSVSLSGWWVRDGSLETRITFPAGTAIAAGDWLTVRVGKGTNTKRTFYLNRSGPMFANLGTSGTSGTYGDGAYLFDPQGDLRAHAFYRCMYRCADPTGGNAYISRVNYDAPGDDGKNFTGEYVEIRALAPVNLSWTVLEVNGHTRELGRGSYLYPGETLRIHSGKGPSTRLVRYWNSSGAILPNAGSTVVLRTTEASPIDRYTW